MKSEIHIHVVLSNESYSNWGHYYPATHPHRYCSQLHVHVARKSQFSLTVIIHCHSLDTNAFITHSEDMHISLPGMVTMASCLTHYNYRKQLPTLILFLAHLHTHSKPLNNTQNAHRTTVVETGYTWLYETVILVHGKAVVIDIG